MSWWCTAQNLPWSWEWRAYPGVWLFVLTTALLVMAWNRRAALRSGELPFRAPPVFWLGIFVLWLALDWPLGALGAGYLASIHTVQFLLMALVAPPLLLRGIGPAALASLNQKSTTYRLIDLLTRPFVALIGFNVVVLLTHLPAVVDTLMQSQLGSFAVDMAWIGSGLVFWWPVCKDEPPRPRFVPALRIGYLVLGMMFSPVMFGIAGFLVYSHTPLYGVYELAPPVGSLSGMPDQQLAGVLMSVGPALVAFVGITVIFFRWSRTES